MATIQSGPPGNEVSHTWNGVFTLNNRAAVPRVRVPNIKGWFSLPEAEDLREPRGTRAGELVRPSQALGKTLVYDGDVRGVSLDQALIAVTAMRGAFRERSVEGTMVLNGTPAWSYLARVMQFDADSSYATYVKGGVLPWRVPFTLGLRMSSGRFLATGPGPVTVSGKVSGATHVLTNDGNTDAEPEFQVTTTAIGTVTVSNNTTGRTLRFDNVPVGTFIINFLNQTATVGGVDVSGKLNVLASNWWDSYEKGIPPGANTLTATGGTWMVAFYHTSE